MLGIKISRDIIHAVIIKITPSFIPSIVFLFILLPWKYQIPAKPVKRTVIIIDVMAAKLRWLFSNTVNIIPITNVIAYSTTAMEIALFVFIFTDS